MARGGSSVPSTRRFRHRAASLVAAIVLLTGLLPVALVLPVAAADPAPTHRFLSDDGAAGSTGGGKAPSFAQASTPLNGFSDTNVWTGLALPIALRFASDGRVFVAEKSGIIKVFDNIADTTPTVFADLKTEVHDYWDRGLLGMTLDPNFPASPYVYALYARDALPGGNSPRWGDGCPSPPGGNVDGCLITGRLVRLTMANGVASTTDTLITDWCQQFPSHSVGDLRFGADGALYVTGGDGASFNEVDYGQKGGTQGSADVPKNPCGDPPAGKGGTEATPTARGGALRAQSLRRPGTEPVLLSGALLRVDPATGLALPNNPRFSSTDANARRIVAHGFRNPFRFTIRPGTNEAWIGDVGWTDWEEIDRIVDPLSSTVANAGWPCYEGTGQQSGYRDAPLDLCTTLYSNPTGLLAPYYTYSHGSKVVNGEVCPSGSSSISGLAFYTGGTYPSTYNNGLFFADHSRNCIWFMRAGTNGLPDKNQISTFISTASNPVGLETGPNGDLFYVDFEGGNIHRVTFASGNQAPTAVIGASPASGPSPLLVNLDGTGSTDPEGSTLTYAWDLDDDGQYDDSTASKPSVTFTTPGTHTVRLRVTDAGLATGTASRPILVDDALPTPVIDTPAASLTWKVGDPISFTGHATDGQGNALPASGLSWALVMQHCPSNCHTHSVQTWTGVASGSFSAPDHEYPSYLELTLTATDSSSRQASTTLRLDPRTVDMTFQTVPSGLSLVVGTQSEAATPFTRRVIVGSSQGVVAGSPQTLSGTTYVFGSWSDGGPATHSIIAPATSTTYTANYVLAPPGTTSYLSDLAYTVTANGWGPVEKDRSNGEQAAGDGLPITLNGTVYAKGLGAHAASDIRYTMSSCTAFTASVGIDDEIPTNRGSLVFQVYLDNVLAYDSGTMTGATATKAVSVNTTGKTALRLVVAIGAGGVDYDHGDWADAKLTCGGAPVDTTPPTVTAFTPANGATNQPTGIAPTAVFSEAIDQATLTTTTFSVTDQTTSAAVAGNVGYDGANRRATFTPSAALAFNRTYLVRVRGGATGIADAAGVRLASDVTWTFTTAAAPDTTPPTVTTFTPANGATGQPAATAPTATFSEAINPSTLTTTTFSLTDQTTLAAVAGTVSYDATNRRATFTPSAALAFNRTYQARVLGGATGVADLAGIRLVSDVTWTFTTAAAPDTTPPTVTAFTPANGATGQATSTAPTATFSEAINPSTLTTTTFSLTDQTTLAAVAGTVTYDATNRRATFTPSGALVAGRSYQARVLGGATGVADLAGVRLAANVTWSFTTAAPVDTTPPTVTGFTPANGATGQPTGTAPTATFSEPINAATLTTTTFSLTDQTTLATVAGSVGYDVTNRRATFTPSAALVAGRTYQARVLGGANGVADVAGIRLVSDVTWTFTTATGTSTTSYLSDLAYTVTSNGWGPAEKDRSNGEQAAGDGRAITLNGTVFAKGLGVHAASDVRFTMSNCTSFTASVGVDDEIPTNRGSIVFQVWLDGVVAYDSGTMTGATATKAVSVNTTGKTALRLVVAVGPGGIDYGHGDWADAKLTCG